MNSDNYRDELREALERYLRKTGSELTEEKYKYLKELAKITEFIEEDIDNDFIGY